MAFGQGIDHPCDLCGQMLCVGLRYGEFAVANKWARPGEEPDEPEIGEDVREWNDHSLHRVWRACGRCMDRLHEWFNRTQSGTRGDRATPRACDRCGRSFRVGRRYGDFGVGQRWARTWEEPPDDDREAWDAYVPWSVWRVCGPCIRDVEAWFDQTHAELGQCVGVNK